MHATIDGAREAEAELRVPDLIEGIAVGIGDEIRRRAESHEIEREASECRDRRVLCASVFAPLSRERIARRLVIGLDDAHGARRREARAGPPIAALDGRKEDATHAADLTAARERHRGEQRGDRAEGHHEEVAERETDRCQHARAARQCAEALHEGCNAVTRTDHAAERSEQKREARNRVRTREDACDDREHEARDGRCE